MPGLGKSRSFRPIIRISPMWVWAIARQWIDQEGVDVIMDLPNSSIALAVAQLATDRNRVFIGLGAGTADLTGPTLLPQHPALGFRHLGDRPQRSARPSTEAGGKTWFHFLRRTTRSALT